METTIITDHKWKDLKYRNEVPQKILDDTFDHLDEDDSFDGRIPSGSDANDGRRTD